MRTGFFIQAIRGPLLSLPHISGKGALPSGYLFRSRLPNTGDIIYSEDDILDADMYIGGWVLPDTDECRAAVPDDGFWYDTEGVPIARTGTEILAWSWINNSNVWFSVRRGLVLYPNGIADQVVNKIAGYYGMSVPEYTDEPTAFFNGMDFRLATYTGGPTYVGDNLGVLRSPGANLPACEGFRLATTVADGAVLGPELIANAADREFTSDTGFWTKSNSVISNGVATITADYGIIDRNSLLVTGKAYYITLSISGYVSGVVGISNSTTASIGRYPNANGTFTVEIVAVSESLRLISSIPGVKFDNISVKEVIPTYVTTDESGNAIFPSTPQKTVTYNTNWTAKIFAETFDKFDISDPLKAPGWLCEPVRTNYALNSATPATHTTGTLAVGTYTLWQKGTGSIVATAGTAVGTFGTASNGTPATITITTAGTVVLTASGTNTWVQLERGEFKTSRIYTTTAPVTRAATIASFPTAGKIPVNDFAIRMIVVPRASGQSAVYLFGSYVDSSNYTSIYIHPGSIIFRKRSSAVNTDASVTLTHSSGVPIDIVIVSTIDGGMQVSARVYSGSWESFTNGTVNDSTSAKANAQIATTYHLGALTGTNQFTGNLSFDCVPIPTGTADPMAWAKTHWGVA